MTIKLERGKQLLYLSQQDVAEVGLSMSEIMEAVEGALQEKGRGHVQMPPKPGLHTNGDAFIHAMPAYIPAVRSAGIKWVSGYPDNPTRHDLPYITGLLVLNCPETGVPLAIMDCIWITAKRTGAVSGVAAKYLARKGSEVLAILATGAQARTQLEALALAVPTLREARCYDVRPNVLEQFISDMQPAVPNLKLAAADGPEAAVRGADIVVTAGPILKHPRPSVKAEWLKDGVLGLPIDFDSMWTGGALQDASKYYVDDIGQYEYYQMQGYFGQAPRVLGDLGDITTRKVPLRESDSEKIISMNLGLALEDMATAIRIYQKALERGMGKVLPL